MISITATKRKSFRRAIDQMCRGCIADPFQPGTWRQQVEACTSLNCALYELRPMPIKKSRPVTSPLPSPRSSGNGSVLQA